MFSSRGIVGAYPRLERIRNVLRDEFVLATCLSVEDSHVRSYKRKRGRGGEKKKDRQSLWGTAGTRRTVKICKTARSTSASAPPSALFGAFSFFSLILYLRLSPPPPSRGSMNQDTGQAGVPDAHKSLANFILRGVQHERNAVPRRFLAISEFNMKIRTRSHVKCPPWFPQRIL